MAKCSKMLIHIFKIVFIMLACRPTANKPARQIFKEFYHTTFFFRNLITKNISVSTPINNPVPIISFAERLDKK